MKNISRTSSLLASAAIAVTSLGSAAIAQTATTPVPDAVVTDVPGAVVVVPNQPGTTPDMVVVTPVAPGTVTPGTPPEIMAEPFHQFSMEQIANDQAVIDTLLAQGFSDIVIDRDGTLLTVTAVRGASPVELVYQTASGRLVSIDGEAVIYEGDDSGATTESSR
ncbi:hypothetical protein KTN05_07935 [Paracoccus sp. Z118]|uniref:hypothetical protein n=1 Tax=Paracoccus sp. Z118 TaxID=2851017 RepID=UPI001C2BDFB0|nr:hypothetical protein [Paracoccus sp. Z118]MBV0891778.1 hypothetical protein [Paracoccus sp. Z118]